MRHGSSVDRNHAAIRDGLRAVGVWVADTHRCGDGFPDLIAWRKPVGFVLLEVKDPEQVPSKRALTPAEVAFHQRCPGPVHVVLTLEEALEAVGLRTKAVAP